MYLRALLQWIILQLLGGVHTSAILRKLQTPLRLLPLIPPINQQWPQGSFEPENSASKGT